jgi:N-acetyl-gamma-glutamyl-phosphate reductase
MSLTASILGASGYSGAEVLRLLCRHGAVTPVALGAGRRAGGAPEDVLPHVQGLDLPELVPVEEAAARPVDVCFACLPAGLLGELLPVVRAPVIVDLSDEHRAKEGWAYGLTEFNRAALEGGDRIANPGCYPTAVLLALLPFASEGLIEGPVVVDAMSGASGAGRREVSHLLFSELDGSTSAYGGVEHRHVAEMERNLADLGGLSAGVSFTPHLIPTARGLLATARARLAGDMTDGGALEVLRSRYRDCPFVAPGESWPATKWVSGSNAALVSARVDARNGWLIASAAIDNLGKGAAGQAVQNANVALGLDESTGLDVTGVWP